MMLRTLRNTVLAIGLGIGGIGCGDKHDDSTQMAQAPSPFGLDAILDETQTPEESANPSWWLNSGGQFIVKDGIGQTLQGDIPAGNYWHDHYAAFNPVGSDGGLHPQNIFRLFTRTPYGNAEQECFFRVNAYHASSSPARNESNGILLVSRYQDNNNLYYAGLRVDGNAVIKKKFNGAYTTLAIQPFYPGTYDHDTQPNLLPLATWIGLRSEVIDTPSGVSITLSKLNVSGWEKIVEAVDAGPAHGAGVNGLWTDFMDAEFKDYKATQK